MNSLLPRVSFAVLLGTALFCGARDVQGQDEGKKAAPPSPAAATALPAGGQAKHHSAFDIFGPELLGLGPGDEIRIVFSSAGCFHSTRSELLFAGSLPDSAHAWDDNLSGKGPPKTDLGSATLNQNDWRRLEGLLAYYRSGRKTVETTTKDEITVTWSTGKKPARQEQFTDSSGRSRLFVELIGRATDRNKPRAGAKPAISLKSYRVDDIAGHVGPATKATGGVARLANLLYEFAPTGSWTPDDGETIELGPSGKPLSLNIWQTCEGHQRIAEFLGLIRAAVRGKAAGKPTVYYGNPRTREALDALSHKVSLAVDHEPLATVVEQLRSRYKVDVRLDLDGLKEAQVPADSPVTLRVHDISLRSALSLMLRELDLRFTVTGSGLSITSREAAGSQWMLAAYPVGDLAGSRARPGLMTPGEVADLMAANCPVWDWSAEGGLGTLELISLDGDYVVVVGHSVDTHEEISGLLYLLRDSAKKAAASGGVLTGVPCFDLPGQEAADEAITKSLAKEVSLACVDEPLTDAAARLAELSGVNVVLDRRALSTAGFRDDMPITFIAKDLDLRSVLGKVCHVKGLAWEIRNEVLLITTAEVAETRRPLLAYSLPDTNAETLRQVVVSTVCPVGWDDIGGDGVAAAVQLGKTGLLLVGQKEKAQREVAELFAILRKIAQDTAAGRPAVRYGWDFPDGSPRDAAGKALSKRVTLDFDKRPLGEALRTFKKSYGLVVTLDSKAPHAHAATAQRSVTIHIKDVPLGLALDEMLRPLGLGWTLREGTVVITTLKEGDNFLNTVFYPVADLVVCRDAGGRRWDDYDTLIRAIKSGIAPDSWAEPAGVGSIDAFGFGKARVLVVSHTDAVQYRIADWLTKARAARKGPPGGEPPLREKPPRKASEAAPSRQ